jgi:hypothetical protein
MMRRMAGEDIPSEKPLGNTVTLQEALDQASSLAVDVIKNVATYQIQNNRVEICILAISALTTGSLWVLLLRHFEPAAAWIGAILSTLTLALSAYQRLEIGPKRILEEANRQQEQMEELVKNLHGAKIFDADDFLDSYKPLRGAATRLKFKGRLLSSLTPTELQEYQQSFGQ